MTATIAVAPTRVAAPVEVIRLRGSQEEMGAQHGRILRGLGGWQPVHGHSVGIVFVVDRIGASLALVVLNVRATRSSSTSFIAAALGLADSTSTEIATVQGAEIFQ